MQGEVYLVDKPSGITSYDVIREIKCIWKEVHPNRKIPKIRHAGTLDPLASGLLLIGVGECTKQLSKLLKLPKHYSADILLGIRTDTGDWTGTVLDTKNITAIDAQKAEMILHDMEGSLTFPAPAYSAIKLKGTPLYKYARAKQNVLPPMREMKILSAKLRGVEVRGGRVIVLASFTVGSGTYIRAFAAEFGRRLHSPATLFLLRRTSIGPFTVARAQSPKETAFLITKHL